jgi:hypothetical protein
MNRRLLFLSGHLSGLVIGAALAWVYFANTSTTSTTVTTIPRNPVAIPVSYPNVPFVPNTGQPSKSWELRYFNRQPYYIIPVDKEVHDSPI